ncbi:hypothetical protein [Siccirubricoccus sp. G192]|uniref:hypothetical protein n=1 Tax=Siccirubricoccus sp. G192 TaxID=2849651 RepID=UPI001C2B7FF0|nr:hypothetical protein [Siccirubricoccus sp. G192]MBV1799757.1 hypothetical protein [Siccirubricoccus sp. G192]
MRAGLAYAALALAAGWVLGPFREFLLVPRIGPGAAVLVEAPLMLLACLLAARWAATRLAVPARPGPRARMGLTALLLLAAELAGSWALRGLAPRAWLARFGTAEGAVSLLLFGLFAALPLLLLAGRR